MTPDAPDAPDTPDAPDASWMPPPSIMGMQDGIDPDPREDRSVPVRRNAAVDCGWGRLIFAHTFETEAGIAEALRSEEEGFRDIAFYVREPHVLLSLAPQELFLDPSNTFRLDLKAIDPGRDGGPFKIDLLETPEDLAAVNAIYAKRRMVQLDPGAYEGIKQSPGIAYVVARDGDGAILGVAMAADHVRIFNDPEGGASLWALAVDPQAPYPGIGEALTRSIAERARKRGRHFLDVSVMHDNDKARALYDKLGFQRAHTFTVKRRNPINEKLFTGPALDEGFNPYAKLLIDEARRRGILVEPIDPEFGYFKLTLGGRTITCRESLTELCSAVAMSRCDDKRVTRRVVARAGLTVPAQIQVESDEQVRAFLAEHGAVVVKPARGEQGQGVAIDLRSRDEVSAAIETARRFCETVIVEQCVRGIDLRVIVIGHEVVAAATRRPAEICGTGTDTIRTLIERQSRRRAGATGGESTIPMDAETERVLGLAGYGYDDVLPGGEALQVRKTANLHTGGTIHDVTAEIHPEVAEAAVRASRALDIPVVGMDFLVPEVGSADYVIIEANERPGLANHEPQPTAQKFIDLLFPQTVVG